MKTSYARAVAIGGLIGGALDIIFAISLAAYYGTAPMRLLQIVASGAFGKAAFDGGLATAACGLAFHFGLSLMWAALFVALASMRPSLVRNPFVAGALFGVLVLLAMRLVVLPLSAFPYPVSFKPLSTALDLLSHMFLFGVPIALAARKALVASGDFAVKMAG